MGNINAERVKRGSALFYNNAICIHVPIITVADADSISNNAAITIAALGANATLPTTPLYNRTAQSIYYTPALSGGADNTATILVTGQDQFGGTITESIALSGTTAQQGTKPFMRVDSIKTTALGDSTTKTVSLGYVAAPATLKVGTPTQTPPAGLIKAITADAVAVANPLAYTLTSAGSYVTITSTLTGVTYVVFWYDPNAAAWA